VSRGYVVRLHRNGEPQLYDHFSFVMIARDEAEARERGLELARFIGRVVELWAVDTIPGQARMAKSLLAVYDGQKKGD
jgi:hypothetical protein